MGNFLSFLGGGGGGGHSSSKWENSPVKTFNSSESWKAHWEKTRQSDKLMLVYFSCRWRNDTPQITDEMIAREAKRLGDAVEFVNMDVDELSVEVIPTFVFFKKGKQVDMVTGAAREELLKNIEKHQPTSSS